MKLNSQSESENRVCKPTHINVVVMKFQDSPTRQPVNVIWCAKRKEKIAVFHADLFNYCSQIWSLQQHMICNDRLRQISNPLYSTNCEVQLIISRYPDFFYFYTLHCLSTEGCWIELSEFHSFCPTQNHRFSGRLGLNFGENAIPKLLKAWFQGSFHGRSWRGQGCSLSAAQNSWNWRLSMP